MPNSGASCRKRRAIAARLFLCLLVVASALVCVPVAADAAEVLPVPILNGTNPVSPGAALSPRIQGQAEGVQTKVLHFGGSRLSVDPLGRSVEPTNAVTLYTEAGCLGAVAATGTLGELEGAGIQVTVAAESITTFYATESDGVETSACSAQGLRYRQVSSPPDPPGFTSVSPESPANNNFPILVGTADPEATVSIYTDASCAGTPLATGSGAEFEGPGIEVAVADNTETIFYGKAALAGFTSACSVDSISYQEVTPASEPPTEAGGSGGGSGGSGSGGTGTGTSPVSPATVAAPSPPHLRTVPGGISNDTTPMIAGSASGAETVKVYANSNCTGQPVAKGSASQLASPGFEVSAAANATTEFSAVSAVTGAQSACSAPVAYVEDSTPPHTRITMGPAAKTAKRKAVFRFVDTTADPPGTSFTCRVGKARWTQCHSPLKLGHLKLQSYVVRVRATDAAGNVESKGATRRFRVVAHP